MAEIILVMVMAGLFVAFATVIVGVKKGWLGKDNGGHGGCG